MPEKIAIIGAGTMGAGIAGVFAAQGYRVSVYSRSEATLDAARATIRAFAGENTQIFYATALDACLEGADIVSENLAEEPDLKKRLFAGIEQGVPEHCLLTTNTSSVPISVIASDLRRPDRLVGIHWFNPPGVMPLVEIVRGAQTSDETVARAHALAVAIGKETIEVAREIPGFVVNRLQYALLREAVHLVESGIVSIADLDRAVETTLAPRWSACGPLKLMDLAGLDTVEKVAALLMPALNRETITPPMVARLVAKGETGIKTGRGFYDWSLEEIAAAQLRRDETVRLLERRRKS